MSLEHYLDDLRDDGREGEEGVFTLALGKAAWKLSRFRLARPQDYPTHLVACAVAAGASYLEIQTRTSSKEHQLTARFDGEAFLLEDLEDLSSPLTALGEKPALRELSIVLNVLGPVGKVSFCSYTEDNGAEVRILDEEVSLHGLDSGPSLGQTLSLNTPHLSVMNLDILGSRCCLAPLRLSVNGTELNTKIDLGAAENMLFGLLTSQNWTVNNSLQLPVTIPTWESDSSLPMVLAAGWPTQAQRWGLQGLVDGVLIPLDEPELESQFVYGLSDLSRLKRDLSGQGFVRDQAYQEVVQQFRAAGDELLARVCDHGLDISPNMEAELRDELLHRFRGRSMPDPIRRFLGRALISDDSHRQERLLKIARESRESKSDELFQAVQSGLRAEAGEDRRRGFLNLVGEWLQLEGQMWEEAGRSCLEWTRLSRYWSHLLGQSWEGTPDPGDPLSPADEFRNLLCDWSDLGQEAALNRLEQLEIPHLWKALLLVEAAWQAGKPELHPSGASTVDDALAILSLYEQGNSEEAGLKLDQYLDSSESLESLWREVIYHLYRGRVGFAQAVTMTARRSLGLVLGERPDLTGLLLATRGHIHCRLFAQDLFSPELLPKLYLRLGVLRRSKRGDEGFLLLTQVLLQLSLGDPDGPLHVPEELPPDPFRWWGTSGRYCR